MNIEEAVPVVKYHGLNTSKDADFKGAFALNGTAVTATAAELNAAADVSTRIVSIPYAATYTLLAENSGKTHVFPNLTADIVVALPAEAAGLEYTFIYGGVAADAQDWQFNSGSNTNYFLGGILVFDTAAGDEVGFFAPDGNSNSKFNVLTPDVGTRVNLLCDGTLWYISGFINSATDATFADQ